MIVWAAVSAWRDWFSLLLWPWRGFSHHYCRPADRQWATADWDQGATLVMLNLSEWTEAQRCGDWARLIALLPLYFSWIHYQGCTVANIILLEVTTAGLTEEMIVFSLFLSPRRPVNNISSICAQEEAISVKCSFLTLSIFFAAPALMLALLLLLDDFKECKSSLLLRIWALHRADRIHFEVAIHSAAALSWILYFCSFPVVTICKSSEVRELLPLHSVMRSKGDFSFFQFLTKLLFYWSS